MSSILITFEGNSLTGKSTALKLFASKLEKFNPHVLISREPGGTNKAEMLRNEISILRRNKASEDLIVDLIYKARESHLKEVIIPHMGTNKQNNAIMLIDRFFDSTIVYQYLEGGANISKILNLNKKIVGEFIPDLTFLFYFPKDKAERELQKRRNSIKNKPMGRSQNIGDESNIEEYLQRQSYYLELPHFFDKHNVRRNFILIDASLSRSEIVNNMMNGLIKLIQDNPNFKNVIESHKLINIAA